LDGKELYAVAMPGIGTAGGDDEKKEKIASTLIGKQNKISKD